MIEATLGSNPSNTKSEVVCRVVASVTRRKSPNVYKSCPKIISLEKLKILTPLQNLPNNVRDLGKYIIAKEFEKSCPKSNKSPYLVTLLGMVTLKCKRNLR